MTPSLNFRGGLWAPIPSIKYPKQKKIDPYVQARRKDSRADIETKNLEFAKSKNHKIQVVFSVEFD